MGVKCKIYCNPDDFFSRINHLESESQLVTFLFADIVDSNRSDLYVKKQRGGYVLYYTRPLSIFMFRKCLFDYKLQFTIIPKENRIEIDGKISLKTFVIAAIISVLSVALLQFILSTPDGILDYLFLVFVPGFLLFYFSRQYIRFKRRMYLLLSDIAKSK